MPRSNSKPGPCRKCGEHADWRGASTGLCMACLQPSLPGMDPPRLSLVIAPEDVPVCPDCGGRAWLNNLCLNCPTGLLGPAPAVRAIDRAGSRDGARVATPRANSAKARLLQVYASADKPLTDDQAADLAGLPERSCWWKRASELREAGLTAFTGHLAMGSLGAMRETSVVTAEGRRVAGLL